MRLVALGKGDPNRSLEGPGFQHIINAHNNPPPPPNPHVPPRTNTSLQPDPAQEAVQDEINSTHTFSAIQGPPGTGKTWTAARAILQRAYRLLM